MEVIQLSDYQRSALSHASRIIQEFHEMNLKKISENELVESFSQAIVNLTPYGFKEQLYNKIREHRLKDLNLNILDSLYRRGENQVHSMQEIANAIELTSTLYERAKKLRELFRLEKAAQLTLLEIHAFRMNAIRLMIQELDLGLAGNQPRLSSALHQAFQAHLKGSRYLADRLKELKKHMTRYHETVISHLHPEHYFPDESHPEYRMQRYSSIPAWDESWQKATWGSLLISETAHSPVGFHLKSAFHEALEFLKQEHQRISAGMEGASYNQRKVIYERIGTVHLHLIQAILLRTLDLLGEKKNRFLKGHFTPSKSALQREISLLEAAYRELLRKQSRIAAPVQAYHLLGRVPPDSLVRAYLLPELLSQADLHHLHEGAQKGFYLESGVHDWLKSLQVNGWKNWRHTYTLFINLYLDWAFRHLREQQFYSPEMRRLSASVEPKQTLKYGKVFEEIQQKFLFRLGVGVLVDQDMSTQTEEWHLRGMAALHRFLPILSRSSEQAFSDIQPEMIRELCQQQSVKTSLTAAAVYPAPHEAATARDLIHQEGIMESLQHYLDKTHAKWIIENTAILQPKLNAWDWIKVLYHKAVSLVTGHRQTIEQISQIILRKKHRKIVLNKCHELEEQFLLSVGPRHIDQLFDSLIETGLIPSICPVVLTQVDPHLELQIHKLSDHLVGSLRNRLDIELGKTQHHEADYTPFDVIILFNRWIHPQTIRAEIQKQLRKLSVDDALLTHLSDYILSTVVNRLEQGWCKWHMVHAFSDHFKKIYMQALIPLESNSGHSSTTFPKWSRQECVNFIFERAGSIPHKRLLLDYINAFIS